VTTCPSVKFDQIDDMALGDKDQQELIGELLPHVCQFQKLDGADAGGIFVAGSSAEAAVEKEQSLPARGWKNQLTAYYGRERNERSWTDLSKPPAAHSDKARQGNTGAESPPKSDFWSLRNIGPCGTSGITAGPCAGIVLKKGSVGQPRPRLWRVALCDPFDWLHAGRITNEG